MDRDFFPDLLGNERIKQNLAVDAANGKCPHAYIIEGTEGSGKHLLAKLIAAASVCPERANSSYPVPCGVCPTCHRILHDISADVSTVSLNGKASIGVEAIRNLKMNLYVTPNDSEKKFYIIENAELMTAYQEGYDLEEVETMALALGMVPNTQVRTVRMDVPGVAEETSGPWEQVWIFLTGLFA